LEAAQSMGLGAVLHSSNEPVMKKIAILVLLAVAVGCCFLPQERKSAAPSLAGRWSGAATFLDRELASEYGEFPVSIEVHADDSVTGAVGAAQLTEALASEREDDFVVEGLLQGQVFESGSLPSQGKNHVVFVLSPPVEGAIDGNLHLKSNGVFDFTMRVCGLKLARVP